MPHVDARVVAKLRDRRKRRDDKRAVAGAEAIEDAHEIAPRDAGLGEEPIKGKRATRRAPFLVDLAQGPKDLFDHDLEAGQRRHHFVRVLGECARDAADRVIVLERQVALSAHRPARFHQEPPRSHKRERQCCNTGSSSRSSPTSVSKRCTSAGSIVASAFSIGLRMMSSRWSRISEGTRNCDALTASGSPWKRAQSPMKSERIVIST